MKCLGCDQELVAGERPTVVVSFSLCLVVEEVWPMPVGSMDERAEMHLDCVAVGAEALRSPLADLTSRAVTAREAFRLQREAEDQALRDERARREREEAKAKAASRELASSGGMVNG
jgi:hypothetical protein